MLSGKLLFVWLSLACLGCAIVLDVLSLWRLQAEIMRNARNLQQADDADANGMEASGE